MTSLGPVLLAAALAIEAYGIGASVYGVRARRTEWVESGRRAPPRGWVRCYSRAGRDAMGGGATALRTISRRVRNPTSERAST